MKKIILTAVVLSTTALCACNGSGGDNGGRRVSGIWTGAVTKLSDTCGAGSVAPQTLNFTHNVNQDDESVTLVDENGLVYTGGTLSDDGFSADGVTPVAPACSNTKRAEYQNIDEDDDPTASINFDINTVCTGGQSCEVKYSGTAARNTGVSPTPTATPGVTPTPGGTPVATGGCLDINPNPAADAYTGDGACGISTAVFRTSGQTVVLEPFGANGATSFAVNPVNSSSAASSNVDLSIKGETGYACSMACSAPSTFSVTCFKEGGTTCIEKF